VIFKLKDELGISQQKLWVGGQFQTKRIADVKVLRKETT
jgi:hypothetical protein